jgi:23S rRNA pseudouridine2605 synthase
VRGVPLNRAFSKLGLLSRSQATEAILAGRVKVNGRLVRDPAHLVIPERVRIAVDDQHHDRAPWRTILFHKPRGVVTTRRDPEGRRTIYDVLGRSASGLVAVGRLDLATSGLLLLTNDTQLAHWLSDPANAVPRTYLVAVRGELVTEDLDRLEEARQNLVSGAAALRPISATVRKSSGRESHLVVELREGKNREIRRLLSAIGHEVTRLKRVSFGPLTLAELPPGVWREVSSEEIRQAFRGALIDRGRKAR